MCFDMLTKKMIMTLIISNNEVMKVPTAFANWLSPKRGGVNDITLTHFSLTPCCNHMVHMVGSHGSF